MARKKGICNKLWLTDIGHYGGLFVDIPKEHFSEFKNKFPKREFPRRLKKEQVADHYYPEMEAKFHKKFPKSQGEYYALFFAERTKGLKRLDKIMDQDKCIRVRYGKPTRPIY